MITIECPHCKMKLALGRGAAERIAREVALEEIQEFCRPPLTQPHLELKIEASDDDIRLLGSLGIKP